MHILGGVAISNAAQIVLTAQTEDPLTFGAGRVRCYDLMMQVAEAAFEQWLLSVPVNIRSEAV